MPTPESPASPRQLAWQSLCRWGRGGVFAESLIHSAGRGLSTADRGMLQAIVLGTLRHLRWLDHLLHTLRQGRPVQEEARWLLLSGLCQLFVLRWAEYAVVNELVGLAPARLRPLVNGVLRQALRREADWEAERPKLPPGVRYSMPDWLVERWMTRLGREECHALLACMGEPAAVYAHLLRPMPTLPEDWQPVAQAEGWYRLPEGAPLPHEALRAGLVYVADPSTRHSVELLAPRPGERLLDTCAAPGGKSASILAATGGDCYLLATDAEEHRLPMLRENLERIGSAQVAQHDWTHPCPEDWREAFDAVLVDAPCSNSGVFQRRVDARWRLTPGELHKLVRTQRSILENALQAVRPGGRLVYSTCSIEPEENSALVQKFLKRHPDWQLEKDILALPHRVHSDGAYAALLRRSR